jgi:diguanylate cyclase (GGDEF)-like protein/PAS domain S-box-containing protein
VPGRPGPQEKTDQSEDNQQDLSSLAQALLQTTGASVYIIQNGRFVYGSPRLREFCGYTIKDLAGVYCLDLVHPDDREKVRQRAIESLKNPKRNGPVEYRFIRRDGTPAWVLERVASIHYHGTAAVMGSITDISDLKEAQDALARSEERYRTILEQMQDGYFETDLDGNVLFSNHSAASHLGLPSDRLIGMNYREVVPQEGRGAVQSAFSHVLNTGVPNTGFAHQVMSRDGSIRYAEISISPMKDAHDRIVGFRAVSRDVTERKRTDQLLSDMATHDYLTGLPNRVLLNDRFEVAVAQANRNNYGLALMSLDLDSFKEVNDTMGHAAGDGILKSVGARLTCLVRSSDTVARLGGDEFVFLLQEIRETGDATTIADKIVRSFEEPFAIGGRDKHLTVSIGIALYPADGNDLETLLRESDASMYYSKRHGGNRYKVYSASDQRQFLCGPGP